MTRQGRMFVAALAMTTAFWGVGIGTRTVAAQDATSANDGVYTDAQAARGKDVYEKMCAACHEPSKFSGKEFASAWAGKPLANLWDALQTMPMDNPGSLKPLEYADIIAHMLKTNGYPAGQKELPGSPDVMKTVKLDEKKP